MSNRPADASRIHPNIVKQRLLKGEPAYIMNVRYSRSVDLIGVCNAAGVHGFYIDMQHGSLSIDTTAQLCTSALMGGVTPLIRLPPNDRGIIQRVLDGGAQGIIAPDIRSAAEAKEIVDAARVAPLGRRLVMSTGPHGGYGKAPLADIVGQLDGETLVIVMIESLQALEAIEEIVKVPGLDAVFIGSGDLTTAMGIPGRFDDERLRAAYRTVIAAAAKEGKMVFVGGIKEPKLLSSYIAMGATRCYFMGNDVNFIIQGARAQVKALEDA